MVGVISLLLVAALVSAVALWPAGGSGDPKQAAAFTLEAVRPGEPAVTLPVGRPAVINFFAAWCDPCRDELPLLVEAAAASSGSVSFVGIDVKDSRSNATDLLGAAGVSYPSGYDPAGAVADAYRVVGMPTTVFVAADGTVAGVVQGPLRADELRRRVLELQQGADLASPMAMRNAGATLAFQPISRKSP
jgi:thiol-disulfide isomerase/thioredoxin